VTVKNMTVNIEISHNSPLFLT